MGKDDHLHRLAQAVFDSEDREYFDEEIEAWGGNTYRFLEMDGVQRSNLRKAILKAQQEMGDVDEDQVVGTAVLDMAADLVTENTRDPEDGSLVFKPGHKPRLQKKCGRLLERLGLKIVGISKLDDVGEEDIKKD